MEDSTLHQGIFIQRPKPKRSKKAVRRINDESLKAFGNDNDGSSYTADLRYQTLKSHLELVQTSVQELEKRWHNNLVGEISSFILTNANAMFESELVTPIGFLQTGLSADENKNLFDSITTAVKDGVTSHVARLKSTVCPNVKTAFQNICKQLMRNNIDVSRFNETGVSNLDESFASESNDDQVYSNNRYLSMHDLQQWYESKYKNYYKNQLMKNSPTFRGLKIATVPLSRVDYTTIHTSPTTPNVKLNSSALKSRKSLFSPHSQNEIVNSQVAEKRKTVEEINVENRDFSTPKKSERTLRSNSSQKKDIIDEDNLNCSTPVLSIKRVSRRCFAVVTPQNKCPSPNDLPSPISKNTAFDTPKRIKPLEPLSTPKRVQTHLNRVATPRYNNNNRVMPIVLIIDDVDYFPANVIQQIFQLLSCAKLPLILVVGVIHYYESFSRFVPQQCSTTLMYKTFSTVTASKRLNDFFAKVMYMQEFPLILSGRIVEYLSDYFLLHHFSITRLLQAYKLCLVDYYSMPKSLLGLKGLAETLSDISPEDLLTIVETTSIDISKVSASMRLRTPTKGKNIPSNTIKSDVCEIIENLHPCCVNWFASLHFLYGLCRKLPNSPLGKNIRELYIHCFAGDLFSEYDNEQSRIDQALYLMELVQQKDLQSRLEESQKLICDFQKERRVNETEFVSNLIESIKCFIERLQNAMEEEKKIAKDDMKNEKVPPIKIKKINMTLYQLKETLKKDMDRKKGISVFSNLRKTIIDFVRKIVKDNLRSFPTKLNEIFVYDNLQFLKQHFSPSYQEKVHKALLFPSKFLQCQCCKDISSGSVIGSLPDTSIVYKLLLEQPYKTVELNGIYESFLSTIEVKTPKKRIRISKSYNGKNEDYLLRFRQAVAELQHMGFILRSKQHPDEVTRQIW